MATNQEIKILWDQGTAYDFFTSLYVLHFPDEFGLRGAWAAGVRSRLPSKARDFLEVIVGNFNPPLNWVHSLSAPKDAATALVSLKRIPVEDRLSVLRLCPFESGQGLEMLNRVSQSGSWDQGLVDDYLHLWRQQGASRQIVPGTVSANRVEKIFKVYAEPIRFGQNYLEALQVYYEVFFSEEEKRISPKLEKALTQAKQTVEQKGVAAYLQSINEQLALGGLGAGDQVVLAPSYWCARGVLHGNLEQDQHLILFGARLEEESLVPGEIVPEELLQQLKAMTDPTRMRILRYLLQEQLTPAELARRLRLRAPTVTHHLQTLRSAGMVQFVKKGKNEHLYYAKMGSIKNTYNLLKDFLEQDVSIVEGFDLFDNDLL
ncbi:MAG: metalloregulator ArsR/SmtB family transcription factor [Anaerolineales bacterium]|jgi:DNA-binding transcriptional ArsR family regulator